MAAVRLQDDDVDDVDDEDDDFDDDEEEADEDSEDDEEEEETWQVATECARPNHQPLLDFPCRTA